jgi:predicted RNA-binding Zn-ribbon protein involved in translation (DUF1610 family)
VYSPESEEKPLKRFLKTKWFRLLYVLLIALASSVVMVSTGCLSAFFIPLLMFAVPYYLKERKIRHYLVNGLVVLLLCLVFVNIFRTALIMTSPKPDLSAQAGNVTLSSGSVDPFTGPAGGNYSYSVVYTNTATVDDSNVTITLRILDYVTAVTQTVYMTKHSSHPVSSDGWLYLGNLTLPEGVYLFYFTATTGVGTGATEVATPYGLGPINAPWTTYSSALAILVVIDMLFPFTLYLIIIGMYWWTGKAKMMRSPARMPSEETGADFECTNCGAEVTAAASKCPRCGAIFEEDEEPIIRAKKVEKGREGEAEEKSGISKKDWK